MQTFYHETPNITPNFYKYLL